MRIEKKGTTYANVMFSKVNATDVITAVSAQGKGARNGSMEAMMGDGFKRTGYHLGRILASNLKPPLPTVQTESVRTPSATVDSIVFVKLQPSKILQAQPAQLPPQKGRQLPRATLKADAGYGWRIGKINPDLTDFEEYFLKHLMTGFAWDTSFDYFFKDKFGVRMNFNQYRTSYGNLVQDLNTGKQGELISKQTITYIGPAFIFRLPFAHNTLIFTANAGMGYIEYRGKLTFVDEYNKFYGATLGSQIGTGLEYKVSPQLGIGINMLITNGVLYTFKFNDNGVISKETFDAGKGEGLLQFKLGAGIRFYIK